MCTPLKSLSGVNGKLRSYHDKSVILFMDYYKNVRSFVIWFNLGLNWLKLWLNTKK
jgi:hypothetical protein